MLRRLVALAFVLAAAGCGGDGAGGEGDAAAPTAGPLAVDACLAERGFGLQPAASGVSAVSPTGVAFTIAFFDSPEAAASAAAKAGRTAVDDAVVTTSGKRLPRSELATIEECIRGSG